MRLARDHGPAEFREAMAMLPGGSQDLSALIDHNFEFSRFHEALTVAADAARAAKVMLTFPESA
jgi:threonine dehydrogenase-like Zn-dependent dehydrogenase